MTHDIYSILFMGNHIKDLALLFITKLGQHPIILDYQWVKKYRILLNIINNSITFFSEYYIYLGAFLSLILPKPIKKIVTISKVKQ